MYDHPSYFILNRHELLGRAFGVGSVELFTHNMKQINFTDSFVPANAPPSTPGQYGEYRIDY